MMITSNEKKSVIDQYKDTSDLTIRQADLSDLEPLIMIRLETLNEVFNLKMPEDQALYDVLKKKILITSENILLIIPLFLDWHMFRAIWLLLVQ